VSLKELGLKLGDVFTLKALAETKRRGRESYSRSYKRKLSQSYHASSMSSADRNSGRARQVEECHGGWQHEVGSVISMLWVKQEA